MAYESVRAGCGEGQPGVGPSHQRQRHLPQTEQVEMIDQEGGDQHQRPPEGKQAAKNQPAERVLHVPDHEGTNVPVRQAQSMTHPIRQRVRYLRTSDGIQLAWSEAGTGPVLVKAANWLTHLEYDLESPVWRHWTRFFSEYFRFVRHDERGCGMSDWVAGDLSVDRWVSDLEEVIAAAGIHEPVALLGISQGAATCIGYTVKHPERVSRLVLYGAYARGVARRGNPNAEHEYRAIIDLARLGWGKDNPAFRQVFTSRFIPQASDDQVRWFNDLCRRTTSPEMAGQLLAARGVIDVSHLLGQIRVPTLVLHGVDDGVTPIAEGRLLASEIAAPSLSSSIRATTSCSSTSRHGAASATLCWSS